MTPLGFTLHLIELLQRLGSKFERMRGLKLSLSFSLCISLVSISVCDDVPCSEDNQCTEGCCSSLSGVCGYGPSYCGSDYCIAAASTNGSCAQLAECDPGVNPGWGETWGMFSLLLPHGAWEEC